MSKFVGAGTDFQIGPKGTSGSGIKVATVSHGDVPAPIPILARDPDEDIPPDVGAMLIAVLVGAGLWGGIVWAVFKWLVK